MSQSLTVQLTDETLSAIRQQAEAAGMSPNQVASASLEQQFGNGNGAAWTEEAKQAARQRFERHFGAVDLGHPTGVDNEGIDADLAREYADKHEDA